MRRKLGLFVAVVLFVGGLILGVVNLPEVENEPRWELLAIVGVIGVPLTLVLNAAEYQVTAAIAAFKVPIGTAFRVGVLATAANMLPIPGAVLVRAHAIRKLGGSYGSIARSTGIVGVCFVGVTCALASGVLLVSDELALGSFLAIAGLLAAGLAFFLLRAERPWAESARLLTAAMGRALVAMLIKAGRLYLVLIAFGYEAGATQAVTLTVASVIATMLGFFPGGLGMAEALGAAFAPLVGLSAAVGFVALAVDRLITMVVLVVIGAVVFLVGRRRDPREAANQ